MDVDTLHGRPADWVVVDCRFTLGAPDAGENAWQSGHIPGAAYAHLDRDLASPVTPRTGRHPLPERDAFQSFAGALGIGPDTQVVCYDDSGGAIAGRLWWLLRFFGHEHVAVLDGGFSAWTGAGLPVGDGRPDRAAGEFHTSGSAFQAVGVDQLREELAEGVCVLLDARSGERFRGEKEPIDPVAGRVPGARNRPFQWNLDDRGRFLPRTELRSQFETLLGPDAPQQVVHMCGSGVTACHNLLAMEHAGLTGSRLYVGSWSEWIHDPARPVATGDV